VCISQKVYLEPKWLRYPFTLNGFDKPTLDFGSHVGSSGLRAAPHPLQYWPGVLWVRLSCGEGCREEVESRNFFLEE
jgi:hypothetical protein